jgi:hypothetical protein
MPAEPPSNGEYMIAAYGVAAVILVGYWVRLWRKAKGLLEGKPE